MKIVVIGSANMDYTSATAELPKVGETIFAKSFYVSPGGKGANQAVAAARLGAEVSFVGKVGKDSDGQKLVNLLQSEKIDTTNIYQSELPTGSAQITVDESGHNTIVVNQGSNFDINVDDIDNAMDVIKDADAVIMQLEIPLNIVEYVLNLECMKDKIVVLNPAPAQPLSNEILASVDYLTPNETELFEMTGIEDMSEAAQMLLSKGVKKLVVTVGEEGVYYFDKEQTIHKDIYKVKAVDTTAAGDSFNAALVVGLLEGKKIDEALDFANKVGSKTVTKPGAMESLPYRSEIN